MGIDTAIPCGLILNELVSNALKYAFPEGKGMITITMTDTEAGHYELVIKDNGIGMPASFELDQSGTLGVQLVKGLVEEQLEGEWELQRHPGTTWRIRFQE